MADNAGGHWPRHVHPGDASVGTELPILALGSGRGQSCPRAGQRPTGKVLGHGNYMFALFYRPLLRLARSPAAILPTFNVPQHFEARSRRYSREDFMF